MDDSAWQWGPAWRKCRDDINILAWLFEEEKWKNTRGAQRSQQLLEDWIGKTRSATYPPTP